MADNNQLHAGRAKTMRNAALDYGGDTVRVVAEGEWPRPENRDTALETRVNNAIDKGDLRDSHIRSLAPTDEAFYEDAYASLHEPLDEHGTAPLPADLRLYSKSVQEELDDNLHALPEIMRRGGRRRPIGARRDEEGGGMCEMQFEWSDVLLEDPCALVDASIEQCPAYDAIECLMRSEKRDASSVARELGLERVHSEPGYEYYALSNAFHVVFALDQRQHTKCHFYVSALLTAGRRK